MGYKFDAVNIICPLFKNAVVGAKGKFICVECIPPDINLGFETTRLIRLKTSDELNNWCDIFCKYNYYDCPYFQEYHRESDKK